MLKSLAVVVFLVQVLHSMYGPVVGLNNNHYTL